jgi:DNA-binding transcriptional LysR family regulator
LPKAINRLMLKFAKTFLVVAEVLHFRRAAIRLNVSQSVVTQQIAQLEQELGAMLFVRTTRNVSLTVAGAHYFKSLQNAVGLIDSAAHRTREIASGKAGALRLGYTASAFALSVAAFVTQLKRADAGGRIELRELSTDDLLASLKGREIDLAFLHPPFDEADLIDVKYADNPMVVCVSSGHRLAHQETVGLSTLSNDDFILYPREAGAFLYDQIVGACEQHGFAPRTLIHVLSWYSAICLVRSGLGVAFVPQSLANTNPGGVAYLRIRDFGATLPHSLCFRRETVPPILDSAIKKFLMEFRSKQGPPGYPY